MSDFFEGLKEGLEETVSLKKAKSTLRSNSIESPAPPHEYTARGIKKIRTKMNYSQSFFAMVLNVSTKTVQAWESGKRSPSGSGLRFLEIMDKGFYGC